MKTNKLEINFQKSNYLLINLNGHQIPDLNINIDSNIINRVFETKILGVFFDQLMAFNHQIDNICVKASKRVNLFYKLRYFLPKESLNLLYKALIQPLIDYSICDYGFTYQTHYKRIESLQRRAAHVIISSDTDISIIYKNLKWFSFIDRRNYFASIFIFRMP